MKRTLKLMSGILIAILFLSKSEMLYAQDAVKAAPNVYKKVLLENDKVRVIEVEFAPGESSAWHQHPDRVVYSITDGKLEITEKGKAPSVVERKAGTAVYKQAVTHMAKNIGATPAKFIVIELKPTAAKK